MVTWIDAKSPSARQTTFHRLSSSQFVVSVKMMNQGSVGEGNTIYIKQEPETEDMYYSESATLTPIKTEPTGVRLRSHATPEHYKPRLVSDFRLGGSSGWLPHGLPSTSFYEEDRKLFRVKEETELIIECTPTILHDDVVDWECYYCGWSSYSLGRLRRHIVCGHMKKYRTGGQKRSTSAGRSKNNHVNISEQLSYQHGGGLNSHMAIHPGEVSLEPSEDSYESMVREAVEKPFPCSVCSYRCREFNTLKIHMLKHTGEKPFQCPMCDYRCRHSGHLRSHMVIHSEEKPFQCTICNYRGRHSGNFKTHMLTHSEEKPYICSICGYKCRQSGDLRSHMMIHTEQKPFQCTVCHYKCRRLNNLRVHLMTHTGEKPYQCQICNYKCRYSNSLKTHMYCHKVEIGLVE